MSVNLYNAETDTLERVDGGGAIIDDANISTDKVFSSSKVHDMLFSKVDFSYIAISDANDAPDGIYNGYDIPNAPTSGEWYKYETFSFDGVPQYRTQIAQSLSTGKIYSRKKLTNWDSWVELATINDITDDSYTNRIRQSVYAKLGETNNIPAGYLRQGNKPKKMVVLGNSITQHGYREADGIEWTVSDYREMAATRPTSGWVSQVYKYLHDNVNEDLICHKSNASVWEVMPNGSKDFNVILDQKCCLVDTDGPHFDENLTVNDILTEDVDIIIIQLSENIASPTNDAETQTLSSDYTNFYKALFERCPKAKMYQLSPFWKDRNKMLAMAGACQNSNVTCIQLLNGTEADWWVENNHASVQSSVGTQIYDANGNVVATVSAAVAGHPGDVGFNVMATYVVNSLFNQVGGNGIKVPQFGRHSNVNHPECCDFFNTNGTYTSLGDWEAHYKKWFDYILIPGVYDTTFKTPQGQAVHGVITVTQARNSDPYYTAKSYLEITQVCWALNADFKVSRGIVLAASGTNFRPFVFDNISTINMAAGFTPPESTSDCPVEVSVEDTGKKLHGKPVYRLSCYVMEDFEITNSSWYGLTSIPKGIDYSSFSESGEKGVIEHILEIRYIPYDRSPNKTRDYQGNVLYNNIRVYTSARSPHGSWISIASPTQDNQAFYQNDILMFEYTLE